MRKERCSGVWPGRVEHVDADRADVDHVAIVEELGIGVGGVLVLPVLTALAAQHQLRPGRLGQRPRAGDEVGVDVRLRHVRDRELVGLGDGEVLVDVAVGVDDDRLARLVAGDDVRRLGQHVFVEAAQQHQTNLR